MADEGEETPEGAEGEEDLSAEVVVLDDTLKLRYCYSIALLAGEGVKIEDLQVLVLSYCRKICASNCPPSLHANFVDPVWPLSATIEKDPHFSPYFRAAVLRA